MSLDNALEAEAKNHKSTRLILPFSLISVVGPDSEKFLQGQLSCDIDNLSENQVTYATANTPKGRMYALIKITRTTEGFLLRINEAMATDFVTRLSKYLAFFKSEMKIMPDLRVLGLFSLPAEIDSGNAPQSNQTTPFEEGRVHALDAERGLFEYWGADPHARGTADKTLLEYWHGIETILGLPELYPSTSELFILQYLNLQELGAVSFKKGCYTGQEIIARMKFLGKQKKSMFMIQSPHQVSAAPGESIFKGNGEKCGQLVRTHYHTSLGSVALAVLPNDYSESDEPVFLDPEKEHAFSVIKLEY